MPSSERPSPLGENVVVSRPQTAGAALSRGTRSGTAHPAAQRRIVDAFHEHGRVADGGDGAAVLDDAQSRPGRDGAGRLAGAVVQARAEIADRGIAGDGQRGRVGAGVGVARAGDRVAGQARAGHQGAVIARGRAVGVGVGGRPRGAGRGERLDVVVEVRGALPDLLDGRVGGEQRPDVGLRTAVPVGDDGARGLEEPGRVVVDALARRGLRRRAVTGLGVARGVAQVAQDHDGVRGKLERRDIRLAVVLVVVVAVPRRRVEAEAVLGRVLGVVRVRAGPAVAMPEVHDDRRALGRGLDLRPGGVGAVDLHDVRRVLDRLRVRLVGVVAIARRHAVRRPDDDHDPGVRRHGRAGHGREGAEGGEHGEDEGDDRSAQSGLQGGVLVRSAASAPNDRRSIAGWSRGS